MPWKKLFKRHQRIQWMEWVPPGPTQLKPKRRRNGKAHFKVDFIYPEADEDWRIGNCMRT